jgi:hypothetical protein
MAIIMAMDQYTIERWILERHREAVRRAEERSRLISPAGGLRAGEWAAEHLRRLADRLDGGAGLASQGQAGFSPTSSS